MSDLLQLALVKIHFNKGMCRAKTSTRVKTIRTLTRVAEILQKLFYLNKKKKSDIRMSVSVGRKYDFFSSKYLYSRHRVNAPRLLSNSLLLMVLILILYCCSICSNFLFSLGFKPVSLLFQYLSVCCMKSFTSWWFGDSFFTFNFPSKLKKKMTTLIKAKCSKL